VIAKRIVEAAQEHGERDPQRLKRHALQGLVTSPDLSVDNT
jgi:hypothetical protein